MKVEYQLVERQKLSAIMCSVSPVSMSNVPTTKSSTMLPYDGSIACSNIQFGTSNHNFLKYRHLKRVSI